MKWQNFLMTALLVFATAALSQTESFANQKLQAEMEKLKAEIKAQEITIAKLHLEAATQKAEAEKLRAETRKLMQAPWWATPILTATLGFTFGLFSSLLIEPIKVKIATAHKKKQVREMLYQDLGYTWAIAHRLRTNVVGRKERPDARSIHFWGLLRTLWNQ